MQILSWERIAQITLDKIYFFLFFQNAVCVIMFYNTIVTFAPRTFSNTLFRLVKSRISIPIQQNFGITLLRCTNTKSVITTRNYTKSIVICNLQFIDLWWFLPFVFYGLSKMYVWFFAHKETLNAKKYILLASAYKNREWG